MASLLVGEPFGHLLDVMLLVGRLISIFGEINVKTFWALSAVAIHRRQLLHEVKFWDVKMIPTLVYVLLDKIVKVLIEGDPGFLMFPKRVYRV